MAITMQDFTNHIDGLINDYIGGAITGTEFRTGIMNFLLQMAENSVKQKSLEMLEHERYQWSLAAFPYANSMSSLQHLRREIDEVENELFVSVNSGSEDPTEQLREEFADCLCCLLDAAQRARITVPMLVEAFRLKIAKNKTRAWNHNSDNTYSHVKGTGFTGNLNHTEPIKVLSTDSLAAINKAAQKLGKKVTVFFASLHDYADVDKTVYSHIEFSLWTESAPFPIPPHNQNS